MRLIAIHVGRPREIEWRGKRVTTSIFKAPVAGAVCVRTLNLDGDEQSDLSVHGGVDKAVYAYPSEHYPYWRENLQVDELPWGAFGENLTTEGLIESDLQIGDRLRIGTAEMVVTQPRLPCFKLGLRLGRSDMVKRFQQSGRSGFYLAVLREGEISSGDRIELIRVDRPSLSVAEIAHLCTAEAAEPERIRRASELDALAEGWRTRFRERLARIEE